MAILSPSDSGFEQPVWQGFWYCPVPDKITDLVIKMQKKIKMQSKNLRCFFSYNIFMARLTIAGGLQLTRAMLRAGLVML